VFLRCTFEEKKQNPTARKSCFEFWREIPATANLTERNVHTELHPPEMSAQKRRGLDTPSERKKTKIVAVDEGGTVIGDDFSIKKENQKNFQFETPATSTTPKTLHRQSSSRTHKPRNHPIDSLKSLRDFLNTLERKEVLEVIMRLAGQDLRLLKAVEDLRQRYSEDGELLMHKTDKIHTEMLRKTIQTELEDDESFFYKEEAVAKMERARKYARTIRRLSQQACAFCNSSDVNNAFEILRTATEECIPVFEVSAQQRLEVGRGTEFKHASKQGRGRQGWRAARGV
jgi:hypothetical protein